MAERKLICFDLRPDLDNANVGKIVCYGLLSCWVKTFFIGIMIFEGDILNKKTDKLYPIGAILIFIVLWQLAVSLKIINAFSIPSPSQIVVALFYEMPLLSSHLLTTLYEGVLGILVSVVLSFIFSVLMDLSPKFKRTIYPIMILSQTVPIIVLAPLLAMWFGFGVAPKVVVVTLVCFFPITVSMTEGLNSVDHDLIDLMRAMDATKLQIFTKIKFPATMISFFSGLKIAVTYSIMGAIIGEWMGGKAGLGVYMMRVKNSFAYDKMFAAILLVSVTSIIIFKLIEYLQRVTMPWHTNGHNKEELQ